MVPATFAENLAITYEGIEFVDYSELPIDYIEPNAIKVADEEPVFIENEEHTDGGRLELRWNGNIYAQYGCSVATIKYTNPIRSNQGVKVAVAISDEKMLEYFGTTFKSEEECTELAFKGLEILKSGDIPLNNLQKMYNKKVFTTYEPTTSISGEELAQILGSESFLGMTAEQLLLLKTDDLGKFSEIDKLRLAQLGEYEIKKSFAIIGQSGVINPGYEINELKLTTFYDNKYALAAGEYSGRLLLTVYDQSKGTMSNLDVKLPLKIHIEEDLPADFCNEYDITLISKRE